MRHPSHSLVWSLRAVWLAALVAACSGSTSATTDGEGHETADVSAPANTFDDGPAGQQATWTLNLINQGTANVPASEITAHFTDEFVQRVTPEQMMQGFETLSQAYAPLTVASIGPDATDNFVTATLAGRDGMMLQIWVETEQADPHRMSACRLRDAPWASPNLADSWEEIEAGLYALAPSASLSAYEVMADGTLSPVHELAPTLELGIGSAFKLYVLATLAQSVIDGSASWDEELAVHEEWKAPPTGNMHTEAAGTLFSLRHYADMMISISDNTATDHLIHRLGRENIEAMVTTAGHAQPELLTPLLCTSEFFFLKVQATPQQRQDYLAADAAGRRQMIDETLSHLDLGLALWGSLVWTSPRYLELEWFASTRDLSNALAKLWMLSQNEAAAPLMDVLSINPGSSFDPEAWTFMGYKGGSEPGVLSMNWLLERHDGRWFTLSLIVNNPDHDIDIAAAVNMAQAAAALME